MSCYEMIMKVEGKLYKYNRVTVQSYEKDMKGKESIEETRYRVTWGCTEQTNNKEKENAEIYHCFCGTEFCNDNNTIPEGTKFPGDQ